MKIIYFDIASILVLVIIIFSLVVRKMTRGRTNRIFLLLLSTILLATVCDCWGEMYGGWLPLNESTRFIQNLLFIGYFIFRNLTVPLYLLFLCSVTDTWHILKKRMSFKLILTVPYAIVFSLIITNPVHHMVFTFDENHLYQRGVLLYLLYIVSFFYMIYGILYLVEYKKILRKDKFIVLMFMFPFNLIAVIIQLVFPQCLIESFMTTLSTLLITLVALRAEETINPTIGVQSYISYTTDIKKALCIHKPVQTIFIKLVNYRVLYSLFDYDACNTLMKNIASQIPVRVGKHFSMDLYYLENGLFALVTDSENQVKANAAAEKVASLLKKPMRCEQAEIDLDPCICIVRCPQDIDNCEKLLSFGKTFHTYLPSGGVVNDMAEAENRRMLKLRCEIDRILGNAVAEKRFQMYYQPIYSLKEQKFISAEALIRLYDENYGYISPELFIPAAEENGTILQIGDFVLDDVCRFLSKCRKDGLPIQYIEINLSMSQCMQKNLTDKVLYYLEKYDLKPEQINLEITETAANQSQDIVEENIRTLSKRDIAFSLDDYGTGYSNMSRIMELPFRIIKLDKSLAVKASDSKMCVMLKNTVCMLKEIGMEIVVEGVETKEMLQHFTELECDFIQGYYFSKPLPEDEFIVFIKKMAAS